jgi:hypothetical protein
MIGKKVKKEKVVFVILKFTKAFDFLMKKNK